MWSNKLTVKHDTLYKSCTTCPILVFDAFGKSFFISCTTYITMFFLENDLLFSRTLIIFPLA